MRVLSLPNLFLGCVCILWCSSHQMGIGQSHFLCIACVPSLSIMLGGMQISVLHLRARPFLWGGVLWGGGGFTSSPSFTQTRKGERWEREPPNTPHIVREQGILKDSGAGRPAEKGVDCRCTNNHVAVALRPHFPSLPLPSRLGHPDLSYATP